MIVRSLKVRAVALLLLAPQLLSACYLQRPLATPEPVPDTRVLVHLTERGSEQVEPRLGPRIAAVEGVVAGVRGDSLELWVRSTEERGGGYTLWKGEPVAIPSSAVASVLERRLDRRRSFALAGAVVAGAVVLGRIFGTDFIPGKGEGGEPVPPN